MGFKFRKSFKIGKWLRVNVSKSGVGVSLGGKVLRLNRSAKGKSSATVSIPGTGISYTQDLDKNKKQHTAPPPDLREAVLFLFLQAN